MTRIQDRGDGGLLKKKKRKKVEELTYLWHWFNILLIRLIDIHMEGRGVEDPIRKGIGKVTLFFNYGK